MKYADIFSPVRKGNHGLTEEFIYRSMTRGNALIPYWGGNREHIIPEGFVDEQTRTREGKPITVFEGEGIIISLDGSAGSMTHKNGVRFALNHHAGFLSAKNENIVDLEFFAWCYQDQLVEASVSEGSGTLSLETLESMEFDLPRIEAQHQVMLIVKPLLTAYRQLAEHRAALGTIRDKSVVTKYRKFQKRNVAVREILNYMSGNSGLTSQEIYQSIERSGSRYNVLSGATTEDAILGEVPVFHLKGKPIKVGSSLISVGFFIGFHVA